MQKHMELSGQEALACCLLIMPCRATRLLQDMLVTPLRTMLTMSQRKCL